MKKPPVNIPIKNFLFGLLLLLGACGGEHENLSVTLVPDKFSGEAPLEVTFTARVLGDDTGASYSWDFGIGETAQGGPNRSYIFEQAGTFPVSVRVVRGTRAATADVVIDVSDPPVIPGNSAPTVTLEALRTAGKAPLKVRFSAAATDPDGDALAYHWDFGDGKTVEGSTAQTHTYTEAGDYTAVVTVNDGRGGGGEARKRIAVTDPEPQIPPVEPPEVPDNRAPAVSLSASKTAGAAPLTVSFKADASDPEGDPLSYSWNFGDGEKAKGNSSRTVTYTKPGSYTVAVTVSDGLSETSADIRISVTEPVATPPDNTPPEIMTATANPPSGTTPLQVEFSASARDADGDALVYLWDFGDGVISGDNPARHTYQKAATYSASVTVGDRRGGKTREQVTVEVTGAGPGTPDVPFYGEWAWAAKSAAKKTFSGYLSISEPSSRDDSGLDEFFVRGGKGAWTYCKEGLEACGAPTGVGRIDIINFGGGELFDIIFADKTGFDRLVAYDEDDRIGNEEGAPTFSGGGAWYYDGGSSDNLSFTMVKVDNDPQAALSAALDVLVSGN